MATEGCGNACGSAWCCRWWLAWLDDSADLLRLALDRGARVYRARWASRRLLVALPTPCRHLTPDGRCSIHAEKPALCRDFPVVGDGLVVLPRRCPYLKTASGHVALEDLLELTAADLVDMLAARANVQHGKEAAHADNIGH